MNEGARTFDVRGFGFACALLLVCVVVGVALNYATHYALAYIMPTPTPSGSGVVPAAPRAQVPTMATVSSTTPQRVITTLTIADVTPQTGKFIAADLVHMQLYLYQDGLVSAQYPILTKGRPGTPYETPGGMYQVLTKEVNHLNRGEGVTMPYSMQFYGNYFIHGWPTYENGAPVASTYSGGCIRLSTEDAAKVFAFAQKGTSVFVYDPGASVSLPALSVADVPVPALSADAYLVADVDTGDVYAAKHDDSVHPIASVTKLMTALVANETIMFDKKITVPRGELKDTMVPTDTVPETFVVGDLLYPLLMESNNHIADALAQYYGTSAFVQWMNQQAAALDMASTTFADPSGVSRQNVSTPDDLYRLAVYLANKKSFIWDITRTPAKTINAQNGSRYTYSNFNEFSNLSAFVGGKVGHTNAAQDTMVSVFSVPIAGVERRVAVIVLGSNDYTTDTLSLATWFGKAATQSTTMACVTCAPVTHHRKIQP